MADHNVVIDADGNPDPENLGTIYEGETVEFTADGDDVVLCFADSVVFGGSRYEIPDGTSITLTVSDANSGNFLYGTSVGDLSAPCGGHLGSAGEGGGEQGGRS